LWRRGELTSLSMLTLAVTLAFAPAADSAPLGSDEPVTEPFTVLGERGDGPGWALSRRRQPSLAHPDRRPTVIAAPP